jgi:hypothetical protein
MTFRQRTFAVVWMIITFVLPLERWIDEYVERGMRDKKLERRVQALEEQVQRLLPAPKPEAEG